jgi:hypothetical protein
METCWEEKKAKNQIKQAEERKENHGEGEEIALIIRLIRNHHSNYLNSQRNLHMLGLIYSLSVSIQKVYI